MEITQEQKDQIHHYLQSFTDKSNEFDKQENKELSEYWKGQVFGIVKMIKVMSLDIQYHYYLDNLP